MDRVLIAGRNLIAYCVGNPVAKLIRQFQQTLDEIRRSGQEIWHMSDKAGIVFKDNRWYVWMKENIEDTKIEGRIYEDNNVRGVLDTLHTVMPWLSSEQRMNIVRQFRYANHFA